MYNSHYNMSNSTSTAAEPLAELPPPTQQGGLKAKAAKGSKKKDKDKYTLRACSIQKRIEVEHKAKQPRKRGPKPRPKTAPMSKYRRKTANLRERQRMGEINVAFEKLREKLPCPITLAAKGSPGNSSSGGGGAKCEKLTKINILHIAINYIRSMENLLETGEPGMGSFKDMTKNPIRDDKNRKMEVQKVLEALMKRADTSKPNPGEDESVLGLAKTTNKKTSKSSKKPTSKKKKKGIKEDDDDDAMDTFMTDEEGGGFYPEWTDLSSSLVGGGGPVSSSSPHPSSTPPQHQQQLMNSSSDNSCSGGSSTFSSPFNSSMESLHHSPGSTPTSWTSPNGTTAGVQKGSVFKEPDPLFSATTPSSNKLHNTKQLENNNDLIMSNNSSSTCAAAVTAVHSNSCSTTTSNQDEMSMIQDFTDFVEMVDSLNGMPDIEFVQDSFEMFP